MSNNTTIQEIIIADSKRMNKIQDSSVDLIVTSPPYPMIRMWDKIFNKMNKNITDDLIENNPNQAFELMHKELDYIYLESINKLKDDGIICINIGDATRTCNNVFALYPNGSRTVHFFLSQGFHQLPSIIWNKPTNSPNKFMGSGMLPVGAYNTLEYEHILIFRKKRRVFTNNKDKQKRRESAFFWNERNIWCNDIWKFVGANQKNSNFSRERNGSFPLELPYRIISLLSKKGDVVLDMFAGTGTTLLATTALERNGLAVELFPEFKNDIVQRLLKSQKILNTKNTTRIKNYQDFLAQRMDSNKTAPKYFNENLKINVMTKQEIHAKIPIIKSIELKQDETNFSLLKIRYE